LEKNWKKIRERKEEFRTGLIFEKKVYFTSLKGVLFGFAS